MSTGLEKMAASAEEKTPMTTSAMSGSTLLALVVDVQLSSVFTLTVLLLKIKKVKETTSAEWGMNAIFYRVG